MIPMRGLAMAGLVVMLAGCERVVNLTLPEGAKQLVVEARIERVQGNVNGRQLVRLTTTDAFFSNAAPPPARGAVVRVTDETGRVVLFAESSTEPGTYRTNDLAGEVGRRYTLTVDYQDEHYESRETLMPVTPIDSLYFMEPKAGSGPRDQLRATIDFGDPAGEKNFYLWDQLVDGVRMIAADSSFRGRVVSSDELLDGYEIAEFQPYGAVGVKSGQLVMVRQIGLSEQSYRYYIALSEQTRNGGSPFDVPLTSVRGNVANLTNPSRYALGYFMAGEVAEKQGRVP
jgi:hypothetical protein